MKYFFFKILNLFSSLIIIVLFQKCIDPTVPEFQFSEDLIFIDGFITDKPKGSYVSVKKSKLEFGIYKTETINGCIVSFVNSLTNKSIPLTQIEEVYLPSDDFKINSGEKWELNVILPNGENYKSFSETAPTRVEVTMGPQPPPPAESIKPPARASFEIFEPFIFDCCFLTSDFLIIRAPITKR